MISRSVLAVVLASGLVVIACANAPVDSMPTTETGAVLPEPDAGSKGTGGGTKDAGKKAPPPEDEDPAPAAGQCASEATFDTCLDCCVAAHPTGSDTFYGTYIDCLCLPANCATDCGLSLCDPFAPSAPDALCDACISAASASCQAPVATACSADPDCIAFDTCVGDSDCANKP